MYSVHSVMADQWTAQLSVSISTGKHSNRLTSLANPSPYDPLVSLLQSARGTGKVHSFGKRDHAIKRNLSIPVVVRGWLYKQVSSSSIFVMSYLRVKKVKRCKMLRFFILKYFYLCVVKQNLSRQL